MFGRPILGGSNPLRAVAASTGEPMYDTNPDRHSTARPSNVVAAGGNDSDNGVGLVRNVESDAAAFFRVHSIGVALVGGILDVFINGGGLQGALQFGSLAALASSAGGAIMKDWKEPAWERKFDAKYFNAPAFIGGGGAMLVFAYVLGQRGNALYTSAAIAGVASASGAPVTKGIINAISR